jgi:lipid-binding SYLF domain-containing protein
MPRLIFVLLSALAIVVGGLTSSANALTEQEELIEKARFAVLKLTSHPEHPTLPETLARAKGVFIVPRLIKAGIVIGGEGGSGVLLARGPDGVWSYPAFYTMGGGSIGLQFGAQSAEVMFVIMSEAGLEAIIDDQVKIGGDLSVAFGGFGSGREASITTNLDADIYAYSIGEGVFLGAAFEGAVINRRDDWNYYYYGEGANAKTIVFERRFNNPHADELRSALTQF